MQIKALGQVFGAIVTLAVALNVSAQPAASASGGVQGASQASNANANTNANANANAKAMKAANRKLRRDVLRALSKTQSLDSERILVRATGSAVTLSGTVPVADQIQKAGDAAQHVPGVASVSNRITTRPY
jgi:hyperosmotically inducible periplasmic protein